MRTCEEYEALISAFIDGALEDGDREELMAHMAPEHPVRFLDTMIEAVHVYCLDVTSFTGKERTAE